MSIPAPRTSGYGQAAAIYRRAGWDGVLPLDPGTKFPPPDGYTGRDGGYPDGRKVLEWTSRCPGHGLALRLPRGVVGVDVDVYDSKHGDHTLAELEERYGALPPTWSSTSRGEGQPSRIWLFRCPEELVLPGKPGTAIEFIQHHHRYLVAWPTVVEGRQYRWYSIDGRLSARPPKVKELAWLPEAWHGIHKHRTPVADYTPRAVAGDWSQAVAKHHGEGVAGLREAGGRHDSMLPVVLSLVRADERGHPGAAEALDDLHARFVLAVGDRSSAAEAEREWARLEDGAAGIVATTPSSRAKWEDLARPVEQPKRIQLDTPAPRTEPPEAEAVDEEPEPEHGWEAVELGAIHDGNHQRPKPSLLRRTP